MRRFGSPLVRASLATLAATLLAWPFCGYYWTIYDVAPYDPLTGADPVFVSGPVPEFTGFISDRTWKYSLAVAEAAFGAILGIAVYAASSGFAASRYRRETRCGRCAEVLRELNHAQCPACNEPL